MIYCILIFQEDEKNTTYIEGLSINDYLNENKNEIAKEEPITEDLIEEPVIVPKEVSNLVCKKITLIHFQVESIKKDSTGLSINDYKTQLDKAAEQPTVQTAPAQPSSPPMQSWQNPQMDGWLNQQGLLKPQQPTSPAAQFTHQPSQLPSQWINPWMHPMMNPYNPYFQNMTQPLGMGESASDGFGLPMMGYPHNMMMSPDMSVPLTPNEWARRASISSNTSTDSISIPIEHFDKDGKKIEKKK